MTFAPLPFHRFRDAIRRGEIARAADRHREAIEAFTEAMVLRDDDLTPDQEGDLRARIADCFVELGELDAANLALLPTDRLDERRLLAGTRGALLTARGRIVLLGGDYERALELATAAWNVLRRTDENGRVARALKVRGHAARFLGRLDEARDAYTDAMAAARRAGDEHEVGLASANLGYLLWKSGRYRDARRHHRRAVEIHERTGSETDLTRELLALAVGEYHAGDWAQVEALLTRCAERAARADDRRLLCSVEISRGRLALARGEDPRPNLETARRLAEAGGYHRDLVLVEQYLGSAASARGDHQEARRLLLESWQLTSVSAPDGETTVDTAWRLALAEEALGDAGDTVVARLDEALEIARRGCLRAAEGRVLRARANVLVGRGEVEAALDSAERSVRIFRDLNIPRELGLALLALADAQFAASEDPASCALSYREAESVLSDLGARREAAKAADRLAAATGEAGPREVAAGAADDPFAEIATVSAVMEEAIARSRRIAPSNIPVLLTGETGTGKELFARAIHHASHRNGSPFLAINCAALSESLLEAELFGHVKGAFTGAASDRPGIFEAAEGGTVFLDEVGKAPLSLQAKLLRVLDTGEVRRVGGVEPSHVDVRIVAATNRPLPELVEASEFLPDLLYRLRGFEVGIPPLRDRDEDVAHLFERFAGRPPTACALEQLEVHDWPGNVRELRNLAESAAFLTAGHGPIPADALPDWLRQAAIAREAPEVRTSPSLVETEREALVRALRETAGNRSAAARSLGISRQTLYTKIAKYGIGRANAA